MSKSKKGVKMNLSDLLGQGGDREKYANAKRFAAVGRSIPTGPSGLSVEELQEQRDGGRRRRRDDDEEDMDAGRADEDSAWRKGGGRDDFRRERDTRGDRDQGDDERGPAPGTKGDGDNNWRRGPSASSSSSLRGDRDRDYDRRGDRDRDYDRRGDRDRDYDRRDRDRDYDRRDRDRDYDRRDRDRDYDRYDRRDRDRDYDRRDRDRDYDRRDRDRDYDRRDRDRDYDRRDRDRDYDRRDRDRGRDYDRRDRDYGRKSTRDYSRDSRDSRSSSGYGRESGRYSSLRGVEDDLVATERPTHLRMKLQRRTKPIAEGQETTNDASTDKAPKDDGESEKAGSDDKKEEGLKKDSTTNEGQSESTPLPEVTPESATPKKTSNEEGKPSTEETAETTEVAAKEDKWSRLSKRMGGKSGGDGTDSSSRYPPRRDHGDDQQRTADVKPLRRSNRWNEDTESTSTDAVKDVIPARDTTVPKLKANSRWANIPDTRTNQADDVDLLEKFPRIRDDDDRSRDRDDRDRDYDRRDRDRDYDRRDRDRDYDRYDRRDRDRDYDRYDRRDRDRDYDRRGRDRDYDRRDRDRDYDRRDRDRDYDRRDRDRDYDRRDRDRDYDRRDRDRDRDRDYESSSRPKNYSVLRGLVGKTSESERAVKSEKAIRKVTTNAVSPDADPLLIHKGKKICTELLEEEIELDDALKQLLDLKGNSLFYANAVNVNIQTAIKKFDEEQQTLAFDLCSKMIAGKHIDAKDLWKKILCVLYEENVLTKLEAECPNAREIVKEGILKLDNQATIEIIKNDDGSVIEGDSVGKNISEMLQADRDARAEKAKQAKEAKDIAAIVEKLLSANVHGDDALTKLKDLEKEHGSIKTPGSKILESLLEKERLHIKQPTDEEKTERTAWIENWEPVLTDRIEGNEQEELRSMFTIQGFVHNIGFPELCLENLLMKLYDAEIISEDIMIKWFEISDDDATWKNVKGRGQAKLESKAFINWLQEADEEDDDEDDED